MKRSLTETNRSVYSVSDEQNSAFHAYHPMEKRMRSKMGKRVTFSVHSCKDTYEPRQFPLHEQITQNDCRQLWFQKDEVVAAKQRMRFLIMHGTEEEHGSEEMSGLRRYSLERSQHKRSAIHYIIAAHREYPKNHDFVREVSKRCTGWARQMAEEEGFATFCLVYGDPVQMNGKQWDDELSLFDITEIETTDFDSDGAIIPQRMESVTLPVARSVTT